MDATTYVFECLVVAYLISESGVLYCANDRSSTYEYKAAISVSKRFLKVTRVPQGIS